MTMRTLILTILMLILVAAIGLAAEYKYTFHATPVSEALLAVSREHPELKLSFIYKELDSYKTSARIDTDNPSEALRRIIGYNPVSLVRKGDSFYIEALQHGRYRYSGRVVANDGEPVAAASVMLLAPADSTVVTFGTTDEGGRFSIPCDRTEVLAKFSCLGFGTTYRLCHSFDVGTIVMSELPVKLGTVTVEADNAMLYADKSVYLPTRIQKNSSQTAIDLLEHMAIPQLAMISGSEVKTLSGQPVSLFIDYLPASQQDLQAMRVADVHKVEYYVYPSDPRLQGTPYAVNFVMQRYEYGGYVKALGHTNLFSNPVADILANVRFQYKRMTYDVMGSAFDYDRKHTGEILDETFRLPAADGGTDVFTRKSRTDDSREKRNWNYATFRAIYNDANIQASSEVSGKLDRTPRKDLTGSVNYSTDLFPSSTYASTENQRSGFVAYKGYYFFKLPKGNSLTFNPTYSYSHTEKNSTYLEEGFDEILNGASDNTNKLSADLKFKHSFDRWGNLLGKVGGSWERNRTRYTGSANALDRATSSRIEIGANYDISVGDFYGQAGMGWDWDRLQFGDASDSPASPKFDISLQYSVRQKHSIEATFIYNTWLPSPSFKSAMVIASSPLLSYTGNPALTPAKFYQGELSYTWIPNNNFSLSAYGWIWSIGNRYAFDYVATPDGVVRTIKQPMGGFAEWKYGVSAKLWLFDHSLMLSGDASNILNYNGAPYNVRHSSFEANLRARYYVRNWNFALTYMTPSEWADGWMNGMWAHHPSTWYFSAGWANDNWNVRGDFFNLSRWHRRGTTIKMHSEVYDTDLVHISETNRAVAQIVVTYTFGFGKKVERTNQPAVSGSASSGILKQ